MPTVLLETDAFSERFNANVSSLYEQKSGSWPWGTWWRNTGAGVRRPSGLDVKEDTVASLLVMDAKGNAIPLLQPSITGSVPRQALWTDFTLQSVTESREEKMQLVETFGESYVFFFGEQPRVLTCSGVLVNSRDNNWRHEFWYNYDRYFRGTKLVESNAIAYLTWDDIIVQGYLYRAAAQDLAAEPHQIPFSFQMLVHRYENIGPILAAASPQDLVQNSLLRGTTVLFRDGTLGSVQDQNSVDRTEAEYNALRAQLTGLLTPRYGATAAASMAHQIASSESFSTLNTRISNLQGKSGLSFMDALLEYLKDPTMMFNLLKTARSGNATGVAAGLGYGVFNAATTFTPETAVGSRAQDTARALDPLVAGSLGLANLQGLGMSDDEVGQCAGNLFSGENFTAVAIGMGRVATDSPTVLIPQDDDGVYGAP